jgi:putative ABC transport system permease protein
VVADEPTGDLDAKNAVEILALLRDLRREFDKTVVMVTHDSRGEQFVDEIHHLDKGLLDRTFPEEAPRELVAFLWRNLSRNKLRSLLTGGAIALAVALVCFLATMPDGMNRILEQVATNTRVVVHNEAGLVYPLPYAYLQKVRAMPGVVAVTSWTWFGGVFKEEDGVSFPNFAIEPDAVGETWPDYGIPRRPARGVQKRRDGAIVGGGTLKSTAGRSATNVTLKGTVFPVDLTFKIVGTIPNERAPHFWFQREYLEQAGEGRPAGRSTSSARSGCASTTRRGSTR